MQRKEHALKNEEMKKGKEARKREGGFNAVLVTPDRIRSVPGSEEDGKIAVHIASESECRERRTP